MEEEVERELGEIAQASLPSDSPSWLMDQIEHEAPADESCTYARHGAPCGQPVQYFKSFHIFWDAEYLGTALVFVCASGSHYTIKCTCSSRRNGVVRVVDRESRVKDEIKNHFSRKRSHHCGGLRAPKTLLQIFEVDTSGEAEDGDAATSLQTDLDGPNGGIECEQDAPVNSGAPSSWNPLIVGVHVSQDENAMVDAVNDSEIQENTEDPAGSGSPTGGMLLPSVVSRLTWAMDRLPGTKPVWEESELHTLPTTSLIVLHTLLGLLPVYPDRVSRYVSNKLWTCGEEYLEEALAALAEEAGGAAAACRLAGVTLWEEGAAGEGRGSGDGVVDVVWFVVRAGLRDRVDQRLWERWLAEAAARPAARPDRLRSAAALLASLDCSFEGSPDQK